MAQQYEDFDANLAGEEGKTEETKTRWFKRIKKGILTPTSEKKEAPEGLWTKCPECNYICTMTDLREKLFVCPKCNYHHRIGSSEYYEILFDDKECEELFDNIRSKDFLGFTDLKPYSKRLEETWAKSDLKDSMRVATGKVGGNDLVIACMDFEFIGGSLGSVMGEKFSRAVDYCIGPQNAFYGYQQKWWCPYDGKCFFINAVGKNKRQTFAAYPMQNFHTFRLLTDPTFGGISASFGMLGDINIAEPGALIGFAGPRVIKETIKKDLPPGFQRSEFILEHGFLDFIIDRKALKEKLVSVLTLFKS